MKSYIASSLLLSAVCYSCKTDKTWTRANIRFNGILNKNVIQIVIPQWLFTVNGLKRQRLY
jgi:hypothetical protein